MNSNAWLTPSADSHGAVVSGCAHKHAEAGLVEQQPDRAEHHGTGGNQQQFVSGEAFACDHHRTAQARRAGAQNILRSEQIDHRVLNDQHHSESGKQFGTVPSAL
ncbi:MAG: hypothetical protein R3D43_13030 [Tepidamorphaceae bacterium]